MRHMTRLMILLGASLLFSVPLPCDASFWDREDKGKKDEKAEEEVDRISLASILLKDGHPDRAAAVLAEVDPEAEGIDKARYHMLYGLIHSRQAAYSAARASFEEALKAGIDDPMVHVFLAQACFGVEDFQCTIEAVEDAGDAAKGFPGIYRLEASSLWRLGKKADAYEATGRGIAAFPDDAELLRHRVLLLVDMGLYQEAVEQGTAYLSRGKITSEDFAVIAEAFIKSRQYDEAIAVLEKARLLHPGEEDVVVQLARAYLESGHTLTAARLFREASRENPALALDAAELFRRGGRTVQALHLNARVIDQKTKIRQRLGLLIELGRYERAAALEDRLERLTLLDEDEVRYALAYAFFQISRFDDAERHLKKIRQAALFERATELRKAMASCRAAGWACR